MNKFNTLVLACFSCLILHSQTIDETFKPTFLTGGGASNALVLSDNSILVTVNANSFFGQEAVPIFFKMDTLGNVDKAFKLSSSITGTPQVMAEDGNGNIIIGGKFYDLSSNFVGNLLKIDKNGELLKAFMPVVLDPIFTIIDLDVSKSGKIVIIGNGATSDSIIYKVELVNEDGSVDQAFKTITNGISRAIGGNTYIQSSKFISENEIIISGADINIDDRIQSIFKIDTLGNIDTSFQPIISSISGNSTISFSYNDNVIFVINGDGRSYTIISREGTILFNGIINDISGFPETITQSIPTQDGGFLVFGSDVYKVDVFGNYTRIYDNLHDAFSFKCSALKNGGYVFVGQNSFAFSKLNPGIFMFDLVADLVVERKSFTKRILTLGTVYDAVVQDDGKIVVVGNFQFVNGVAISNIARLNPDGKIDETFKRYPTFDVTALYAIEQMSNGNLVVSGSINNLPPLFFSGAAILSKDGEIIQHINIPTTFNGTHSYIYLSVSNKDKIFIGENVAFNINGSSSQFLGKFSNAGNFELNYDEVFINSLYRFNGIKSLDDGRLLIYGVDITYDFSDTTCVVFANEIGNRDLNFNSKLPTNRNALDAIYDETNIYIVGYVGNQFATTGGFISKLKSDGIIDNNFTSNVSNVNPAIGNVERLIPFSNTLWIGGRFDEYNGLPVSSSNISINKDGSFNSILPIEGMIRNYTKDKNNAYFISGKFKTSTGHSSFLKVVDTPVATKNETFVSKINVFPNPVSERLNLEGINGFIGDLTCTIYQVGSGRMVSKSKISLNEQAIETANLSPGLYILDILDSKGHRAKGKFVKL